MCAAVRIVEDGGGGSSQIRDAGLHAIDRSDTTPAMASGEPGRNVTCTLHVLAPQTAHTDTYLVLHLVVLFERLSGCNCSEHVAKPQPFFFALFWY